MDWRTKARVQDLASRLPSRLGQPAYYAMQRWAGGLKHTNPGQLLLSGVSIADRAASTGRVIEGASFIEIGTGPRINLLLALWLCGAGRMVTVDLNRRLRPALMGKDIVWIRSHPDEVRGLFKSWADTAIFQERFARLLQDGADFARLLKTLCVEYLAPADASHLAYASETFDYHISCSVLQHIPVALLRDILCQGVRMLRPDGLFVHVVDFSDQFSHSDRSINAVNFLRFSDSDWLRLAGGRYSYVNRLRIDDCVRLFAESGLMARAMDVSVNSLALEQIKNGFPLDPRFGDKDPEINATTAAMIIAVKTGAAWRNDSRD